MTVPFKWLCEKRDFGVLTHKDNAITPILLVKNLMRLFKLQTSDASDQDLRSGKIPLLVSTNDEIPSVNIACDVAVFKCHEIDQLTPFQYLLSFNSPILIHNYLPYPLEVSYFAKNNDQRLVGRIKSQEAVESYSLDGDSLKNIKTLWKVHMEENSYFYCDAWSVQLRPNETAEHQINFLLHDPNKDEKLKKHEQTDLQLKAMIRPNNNLANKYDNFILREKVYENSYSKKIVLFARNAIVNKTAFKISFKSKERPEVLLSRNSNCICNIPQNEKLQFMVKDFGIL